MSSSSLVPPQLRPISRPLALSKTPPPEEPPRVSASWRPWLASERQLLHEDSPAKWMHSLPYRVICPGEYSLMGVQSPSR